MRLLPVESSQVDLVADWLTTPENHQWLDFGAGVRRIGAASIRAMTQRKIHLMRLFAADHAEVPIGLVALSDISADGRTARLWYLLGEKQHAGRGYTTLAVARLLDLGFGELGLQAVNAWAVECNVPSIRVLERNGFKPAGRLRCSHRIGGRVYDRLFFDLLAAEHGGDDDGR